MECVLLHGIRYQRRRLKKKITDVYRRATMQGLPTGFARIEDALKALITGDLHTRVGLVEQSLSAVALGADEAYELEVEPGTPPCARCAASSTRADASCWWRCRCTWRSLSAMSRGTSAAT